MDFDVKVAVTLMKNHGTTQKCDFLIVISCFVLSTGKGYGSGDQSDPSALF